jgi:hypothetical protein
MTCNMRRILPSAARDPNRLPGRLKKIGNSLVNEGHVGTSFPGRDSPYLFGVRPGAPATVDATVTEFIHRDLGLHDAPVFVRVESGEHSVSLDCFWNVEKRIERLGGSRRYGWLIWQHADAMIEGEFHSLWVSPTGDLLDITPHDGEERVLFVPDAGRRYLGQSVPNVRHFLRDDDEIALVRQMIEQQDELERNPPPGVIVRWSPATGLANIGRNNPCPCGSGRKYKKCCKTLDD